MSQKEYIINDLLMRAEMAERSANEMARTASKQHVEIEECIGELNKLKDVIRTARVDYIAGEEMELLLHQIFEAAGFDPLYNFEEEVP